MGSGTCAATKQTYPHLDLVAMNAGIFRFLVPSTPNGGSMLRSADQQCLFTLKERRVAKSSGQEAKDLLGVFAGDHSVAGRQQMLHKRTIQCKPSIC